LKKNEFRGSIVGGIFFVGCVISIIVGIACGSKTTQHKRVEPASYPRPLESSNVTTSLDDPPPIYPTILENQSTNEPTEMPITKGDFPIFKVPERTPSATPMRRTID
jgi:hypothetical protein